MLAVFFNAVWQPAAVVPSAVYALVLSLFLGASVGTADEATPSDKDHSDLSTAVCAVDEALCAALGDAAKQDDILRAYAVKKMMAAPFNWPREVANAKCNFLLMEVHNRRVDRDKLPPGILIGRVLDSRQQTGPRRW